jgi:hypothetical protein
MAGVYKTKIRLTKKVKPLKMEEESILWKVLNKNMMLANV